MLPYCESPVPQVLFEKSSVKVDRVEREFALVFVSSEFVFLFVFLLATLLELFELRLLLFSLVMLATAKIRITTPMPMKTSTAPMPSSQGQTLRFCGAGGGIGFQAGGGVGGGCPGLKAIVGWGVVSRACGYCIVALGSEGVGTFVLSNGEPSSRQKLSASSV